MKVLSITATVKSYIPCQLTAKNGMWIEVTNICRLRSQNCHKFESIGWIKQACSQALRFGGKKNFYWGKIFVSITVYV